MKILHTSDWHIGHKLHHQDRTEEHLYFFQWLIETINKEKIDTLLVSGDIFDIGYPSNAMLHTYFNFLLELKDSHCSHIIITGGNHDHTSTLDAPRELLKAMNIDIIGGMPEQLDQEVIYLEDSKNEQTIAIIATPFLRDRDIRKSVPGESFDDKMKAVQQGVSNHYRQAVDHILEENDSKPILIAMGHLLITGASASDSEREIHIGSLNGISIDLFPEEIDYFALGHIHRPQKIKQKENIRYSGSPIPLSFSEHKDIKKVILIETHENNELTISELETPKLRNWGRVKGTLEEVKTKMSECHSSKEYKDWFEIQIIETQYHPDIIREYEEWIEANRENDHYKIIKESLRFEHNENLQQKRDQYTKDLNEMSVQDVFTSLLEDKNISDKDELVQSLNELIQNNQSLLDL